MSEQQGELDPTQGQEPAKNVVSGPVAPSDADLVPDNRDVPEVNALSTGLNAGGEFGHTPDHGDANASALAADPEAQGASDAPEDE